MRLVKQAGAVNQHISHVSSSSNSIAISGAQFNGQGIGLTETNGFDMISLANSEQAKELLGFFQSGME